ncbi:MAG: prephenate dehydrogenase [Ardenticatenaceae bacterium]|nr:prephenate dehydrogenase [Ardenticatenaceae bacterium]MCB9004889.1 prephenate dehydrogenase [Ardenticatenaceae bacterium]
MSDAGFTLADARVSIIGLGLMGGSLAMALRGQCATLYGADPDRATRDLAQSKGIVDVISADPANLPPADVLVLAAPVRTILALLATLPKWHSAPAIVVDLGSTKSAITAIMDTLPPQYDPVGGHPMCGKEVGSLANADPLLYQGAPFAFTLLPRSTLRARQMAVKLATAVRAQPLWLDPQTHDRWVAATSHAPYLIANALAAATPVEVSPMVGPGFRSTTRVASTTPQVMLDILATNRELILEALSHFRARLDALEADLRADNEHTLQKKLRQGAIRRRHLA